MSKVRWGKGEAKTSAEIVPDAGVREDILAANEVPMDRNTIDDLTASLAAYFQEAVNEIRGDPEKWMALAACLEAPGADLHIVTKFRRGAIEVQGHKEGKFIVLHRLEVEPWRPTTPFVTPTTDRKQ